MDFHRGIKHSYWYFKTLSIDRILFQTQNIREDSMIHKCFEKKNLRIEPYAIDYKCSPEYQKNLTISNLLPNYRNLYTHFGI